MQSRIKEENSSHGGGYEEESTRGRAQKEGGSLTESTKKASTNEKNLVRVWPVITSEMGKEEARQGFCAENVYLGVQKIAQQPSGGGAVSWGG